MNDVFFIADTHFGDENIIRYENRPFQSVEEMNDTLIKNWNSTVTQSDKVYVLGDFEQVKESTELIHILKSLKGQKYLIKGNHDILSNEYYRNVGFQEVYDVPIVFEKFWILSHEPVYLNSNMPYANIFGHVHNNPIIKNYSKQHYCVSVERINYTPILFSEIVKMMKGEKE